MKKLFLCLICAIMSLGASAHRIDTNWAWFDDPSDIFESQPQYLPAEWRNFDMVVVKRDDPFLGEKTKSEDPLAVYTMNNRKRVTIYIFKGDVPKLTATAVDGYVNTFLGNLGAMWNESNKKKLSQFELDNLFYGKMGEFAKFIVKKDPKIVSFKGDNKAVKRSWLINTSQSEMAQTIGVPFDFYIDTYCYYCPKAKKSVAAIFYKIGINKQVLADPSFRNQALRLMMELSTLFDSCGKKYNDTWKIFYKKVEDDEMSDMESSFIKYFHLKTPIGGGNPNNKKPEEEIKCEHKEDGGELGGELHWWIWLTREEKHTIYPPIDNPLKQTEIPCFAIDIDQSETAVYVLHSKEYIMIFDKQTGKISYTKRISGASSIAWVGNDLGVYVNGKGIISLKDETLLWKPEDEKAKFEICASADHSQFIAKNENWIVTLNAKGEELNAYELSYPVLYMYPAKNGRIWCADENRTLRYLKNEEIGDYIPLPRDAYGAVGLAMAKDEKLLVSTSSMGILSPYTDKLEYNTLIEFNETNSPMLFPVVDSKGKLYAVSKRGGLYQCMPEQGAQFDFLIFSVGLTPEAKKARINEYLNFVFVDSMDNLWISFSTRLILYNPNKVVGYGDLSGVINPIK